MSESETLNQRSSLVNPPVFPRAGPKPWLSINIAAKWKSIIWNQQLGSRVLQSLVVGDPNPPDLKILCWSPKLVCNPLYQILEKDPRIILEAPAPCIRGSRVGSRAGVEFFGGIIESGPGPPYICQYLAPQRPPLRTGTQQKGVRPSLGHRLGWWGGLFSTNRELHNIFLVAWIVKYRWSKYRWQGSCYCVVTNYVSNWIFFANFANIVQGSESQSGTGVTRSITWRMSMIRGFLLLGRTSKAETHLQSGLCN